MTSNSTINNSSPAISPYLIEVTVDVTYAIFLLCIIGVVTNATVFLIIITDKYLRAGTGSMVLQLTVLNFITCCGVYPASSYYSLELLQHGTKVPVKACSFIHFFTITTSIMANWYEAILAVNRFVAVILPLHYGIIKKRGIQAGLVGLCWLLTLALTLPLATGLTGSYISSPLGFCRSMFAHPFSSAIYMLDSFGPFVIIAAAAISILCKFSANKIHHLSDTPSVTTKGDSGRRSTAQERRRNLSRMLVASFVFICVCQLPSYMTATVFPALTARYPQILTYTRLLGLFGSAGVPVLFIGINRDYRRSLRKLTGQLPSVVSGNSTLKPPPNSVAPNSGVLSN